MSASIVIAPDYDLAEIVRAAGQTNDFLARYADGRLYVDGVTQDALEAALAAYNPLPSLRETKLAELNASYEAEFAAIKRQYPESERLSWPIQLREAEAFANDPQAATPFLDVLLVDRGFGETMAELAAKVQAKNLAYSTLSASLTGKRHKLERQVLEALTVEEVAGIVWE